MKSQIQIHEPFKKTWSEPQIIISREDEIEYEKTMASKHACEMHSDNLNNLSDSEAQKEVHKRLEELRNSLLHSEFIKQQMSTPQKCDNIYVDRTRISNVSHSPSQDSDWMIPERSKSRSLPSSPVLRSVSPVQSPSNIHTMHKRSFSFLPENVRDIQESRQSPERDEVDTGSLPTPLRTTSCQDVNGLLHEGYMDSNRLLQGACSDGTSRLSSSPYLLASNQNERRQPVSVKRKLDMDDPYSSSVKRAKTEVAREAGLRYVNQLEMDLLSLKQRLRYTNPEVIHKPSNCACAEMEKHFMEMAMSAYKSIRRYDGSVNGFERFKQELTQTNQVIKDSMELLQNVRRLCVH